MSLLGFVLAYSSKRMNQKEYIFEDCLISGLYGLFLGAIAGFISASVLASLIDFQLDNFTIPINNLN